MSDDIRPLLDAWPFDEYDDFDVRQVQAPDGTPRLQVRLELGMLEMHLSGRPDGQRPHGFDSLLEMHRYRIAQELQDGADESFELDDDECLALQREALQYYHRRVSLMRLGDYERSAADAEHSLGVMDLLRERATNRDIWLDTERFRAYVLSHLARARAMAAVQVHDASRALAAVDEGIDRIEHLFREVYQRPEMVEDSAELDSLQELRDSILHGPTGTDFRSESPTERLRRQLNEAVAQEDYERAAELRDRLKTDAERR